MCVFVCICLFVPLNLPISSRFYDMCLFVSQFVSRFCMATHNAFSPLHFDCLPRLPSSISSVCKSQYRLLLSPASNAPSNFARKVKDVSSKPSASTPKAVSHASKRSKFPRAGSAPTERLWHSPSPPTEIPCCARSRATDKLSHSPLSPSTPAPTPIPGLVLLFLCFLRLHGLLLRFLALTGTQRK